jgi:nitronate monooxygenase
MTLKKLLGIELPIVQAPMAGVQGSALAIAVSNAGGLGSLPCAMLSPDGIRKEIAAIRSQTAKPFNVNFFCHVQPDPDAAEQAAWAERLTPYYRELGLDPGSIAAGPGRFPFNASSAEVLEEVKPPVVSFHFGLPSPDLMPRVRAWGAKVLGCATTVAEARWLEERGVDAIIAQGIEAGGHRGHFLSEELDRQLGTLALIPQIVAAVKIPVIAAGGIAGPQAVAAALALGASGVQVGTAYLLCPEATTSSIHRAALKSSSSQHTALTNLFTGRPARGVVNRIMRELGPLSPAVPRFPLATAAIAPLRAEAERRGSGDFSPLWAGQSATGCREISAGELTRLFASVPPAR